MQRDECYEEGGGDGDGGGCLAVRVDIEPGARGIFVAAQGTSMNIGMRVRPVAARVAGEMSLGVACVQLLHAHEADVEHAMEYRFNIGLLGDRLIRAIDFLAERHPSLPIGIFASGTAAAAALYTAAKRPELVRCVVNRGGRSDLAGPILPHVSAPVLIAVGGRDLEGVRAAYAALRGLSKASGVALVPSGGSDLSAPQELDVLASCTADWFARWLQPLRASSLNNREPRASRGGVAGQSA